MYYERSSYIMIKKYPVYIKMLREMNGMSHKVGDIIGISNVELANKWILKGYAELA